MEAFAPVEEAEEETLTLEDLRAEAPADVLPEDGSYDAVCYALYHDLLQAEGNAFRPYEKATLQDAAEALLAMNGEVYSGTALEWCAEHGILHAEELECSFVSRIQLAELLYRAAEYWGYPTEAAESMTASGETLPTEFLWAEESGMYRVTLREDAPQPEIAVSRGQLAAALVALRAMGGEDALAGEIFEAMPVYTVDSAAQSQHDTIQAAVDAAAEKYGAEGVQVAVIENGVVTDTYAYGWATRGSDPMTADHKMRIASISKVAVGMTAMLLREEGCVDLDADISEYWDCTVKNPDYPDVPVTVRSMLTHTSSIINAGGEVSRTVAAQQNMHITGAPGSSGTYFAGGLTISAADMGKLIAMLAGDGRYEGVQMLSEESVALMETQIPQPVPGGSYQALPMRYWPELYGRGGVYFHTGSAYGVFNCASYDSETGDGVVVLTVGASGAKDDYGIYRICAEINECVYGVTK